MNTPVAICAQAVRAVHWVPMASAEQVQRFVKMLDNFDDPVFENDIKHLSEDENGEEILFQILKNKADPEAAAAVEEQPSADPSLEDARRNNFSFAAQGTLGRRCMRSLTASEATQYGDLSRERKAQFRREWAMRQYESEVSSRTHTESHSREQKQKGTFHNLDVIMQKDPASIAKPFFKNPWFQHVFASRTFVFQPSRRMGAKNCRHVQAVEKEMFERKAQDVWKPFVLKKMVCVRTKGGWPRGRDSTSRGLPHRIGMLEAGPWICAGELVLETDRVSSFEEHPH